MATTDLFGRAGREWLAVAPVSPTARREITVQLAVIAALEAQITGYDPEVKRIAKHPDAQRLQTIPGIGLFGAALLLAEIGTIQRFHTGPCAFTMNGCSAPRASPRPRWLPRGSCVPYIYWMGTQELGYAAWLETETKRVGCPRQTLASSA